MFTSFCFRLCRSLILINRRANTSHSSCNLFVLDAFLTRKLMLDELVDSAACLNDTLEREPKWPKVGPHRMLFQQQLQLSIKTMFSNWSRTATIQFMPMLKPITAALNKNISWYPALDTHVLSYYQFDDKQITSHADIWWQSLQKLLLPQSGPSQSTLKFSGTFVAWIFLASYHIWFQWNA